MARHKDAQADDARKRFVVFAPSIGSKPSTGFNAGFSEQRRLLPRRSRHHAHLVALGRLEGVGEEADAVGRPFRDIHERRPVVFQGDNRLSWTSQNTYGLGGSTTDGRRREREVRLFPVLRHGVPQREARTVRRRRPERQRPLERPAGHGRAAHLGRVRVRHVQPETRLRRGSADLERHERRADLRHARQRDQRAARRARQRQLPHVFRRVSRRRFDVAGAVSRRADVQDADEATPATGWRSGFSATS